MSRVDDEALAWVARQAAGPLDDAAQAAFEAWFAASPRHQGAYLRASAIAHSLDGVTVPTPAAHHRPPRRRLFAGAALAAGIAALCTPALSGLPGVLAPGLFGGTVVETARGELRQVRLADSSAVTLASGSALEARLTAAQRRVMLARGEAWFEVAKDRARPFIVEAGDVRVRAVGTAFSVRRAAQGAHVLVTEGVVEVWANQGMAAKRELHAGDIALVRGDGGETVVTRDAAEVARRLAWRDGRVEFHNEPLAGAVAQFNRHNARQLVVVDPALLNKPLVGRYRIDQPEEFANDVHALLQVPVTIGADTIRIGARR